MSAAPLYARLFCLTEHFHDRWAHLHDTDKLIYLVKKAEVLQSTMHKKKDKWISSLKSLCKNWGCTLDLLGMFELCSACAVMVIIDAWNSLRIQCWWATQRFAVRTRQHKNCVYTSYFWYLYIVKVSGTCFTCECADTYIITFLFHFPYLPPESVMKLFLLGISIKIAVFFIFCTAWIWIKQYTQTHERYFPFVFLWGINSNTYNPAVHWDK